mgnify:FL=1
MHMVHDTILEEELILGGAIEDDEEPEETDEESDATIDDELLGELGDAADEDDELLGVDVDPLLKAEESGFAERSDKDDPEKIHTALEDEEDEEDMDYDSFDDRDEM